MRRRRPVGKNIYTIHYLLDKQTRAFSRNSHYNLLISYYRSSPALMRLKFNKRCYSLLNNAIIKPEHLDNFYRTYRLPQDPFFPLFFMIKRDYIEGREIKKTEKSEYIEKQMGELSSSVLTMMALLRQMEIKYSRADRTPVFQKHLSPKTKKQADLFKSYGHTDWFRFFRSYFDLLSDEYQRLSSEKIDRLLACFTLDCIPGDYPDLPDQSIIKSRYRLLSKELHPDAGGDPALFIEIKWARDVLIDIN